MLLRATFARQTVDLSNRLKPDKAIVYSVFAGRSFKADRVQHSNSDFSFGSDER